MAERIGKAAVPYYILSAALHQIRTPLGRSYYLSIIIQLSSEEVASISAFSSLFTRSSDPSTKYHFIEASL
jgi:hypothetical protein